MSDNVNSIIIGNIPTSRGVYNNSATYYEGNQVVYFGSLFSAKSNNFTNIPPLSVAADGTVSIANETYWEIVTDNIELYNATLSEKSLDKRVGTLESQISSSAETANNANTNASDAKSIANDAKTTADKAKDYVASLSDSVSANTDDIAANKKAITALQLGASPFEYESDINASVTEWDITNNPDGMSVSMPFKVLDGNNDVTADATTTATVICPDGNKIYFNGKISTLDMTLTIPGEYDVEIKSVISGRSANATWKFMLIIPVTVTKMLNGETAGSYMRYIKELPTTFVIDFSSKFEGDLRFSIPTFLADSVGISCDGIQIPTTSQVDEKYIQYDYADGVQEGTYNFTINNQ